MVKPFTPLLTPEQRQAIANEPLIYSDRDLAPKYGVSRFCIRYYRDKEYRDRMTDQRRERLRYKRFLKGSAPLPRGRPPKPKKEKPVKLNKYEKMIHEAVGQGIGLAKIEAQIDANLSALSREMLVIEAKMAECREAQTALYKYMNPDPIVIDEAAIAAIRPEKIVHMTAKEFKSLMAECGLRVKDLVAACGKRYSARAIQSYREGHVPVPKPLADIMRGYPKKPAVWQVG